MTKHQRMLLSGASHCLWCSMVLGLLAACSFIVPIIFLKFIILEVVSD